MDPPKHPPTDLARPRDFMNPSKKPAMPSFENRPPVEADPDPGSSDHRSTSPPRESVEFGARAMDQSTLERDAASKVGLAPETAHHTTV